MYCNINIILIEPQKIKQRLSRCLIFICILELQEVSEYLIDVIIIS